MFDKPTYAIRGGFGKHIMFTSLIPKLVQQHNTPINICSVYPELFKCIDQVYINSTHNDFTLKDIIYYEPIPNNTTNPVLQNWASGLGIQYNQNDLPLFLNTGLIVDSLVNNYSNFIVVQFTGGQNLETYSVNSHYSNRITSYNRNAEHSSAQQLINNIKLQYPDITIFDYSLPNEHNGFDNTIRLNISLLEYIELVKYSKAVIAIDSSLLHIAAAQRVPAIGIWANTSYKQLAWHNQFKVVTNTKAHENIIIPHDLVLESLAQILRKDK